MAWKASSGIGVPEGSSEPVALWICGRFWSFVTKLVIFLQFGVHCIPCKALVLGLLLPYLSRVSAEVFQPFKELSQDISLCCYWAAPSNLYSFCSSVLLIVFSFFSTWVLAFGQRNKKKLILIQHKGKGVVLSPVFEVKAKGWALGKQMDISESVSTRSKTEQKNKPV